MATSTLGGGLNITTAPARRPAPTTTYQQPTAGVLTTVRRHRRTDRPPTPATHTVRTVTRATPNASFIGKMTRADARDEAYTSPAAPVAKPRASFLSKQQHADFGTGEAGKHAPAAQHASHKAPASKSHSPGHSIVKGVTGKGHTRAGSSNATAPVTNSPAPEKAPPASGGIDLIRLLELGALAAGVILLIVYMRRSKRR